MTQQEIADELGISRARVSFIERQALVKIAQMISYRPDIFPYLFDEYEKMSKAK